MGYLRRVDMRQAEEEGRQGDGCPGATGGLTAVGRLTVPVHPRQQLAEDGSAEDNLLGQGNDDADDEIAQGVHHDGHQVFRNDVGQEAETLLQQQRRDDGT